MRHAVIILILALVNLHVHQRVQYMTLHKVAELWNLTHIV
jgi:hypothetical protein